MPTAADRDSSSRSDTRNDTRVPEFLKAGSQSIAGLMLVGLHAGGGSDTCDCPGHKPPERHATDRLTS